MSKDTRHPYLSFDELVELKISAFRGPESKNNTKVLQSVALHGPMLKYGIFKNAKISSYSIASRRVDSLVKREYLEETGTRVIKRGKRTAESMYGLTWRGFIASICIKKVREDIFQVFENNPHLSFTEKELVLSFLKGIITPQEFEIIGRAFLELFLKIIPNLEAIKNDLMSILIWASLFEEQPKLPKGFTLSRMPKNIEEFLKLLDRPDFLNAFKKSIIPILRQRTAEIMALYHFWDVLNKMGDFISTLEVEDQPSKKIIKYLESEIGPKFPELFNIE